MPLLLFKRLITKDERRNEMCENQGSYKPEDEAGFSGIYSEYGQKNCDIYMGGDSSSLGREYYDESIYNSEESAMAGNMMAVVFLGTN